MKTRILIALLIAVIIGVWLAVRAKRPVAPAPAGEAARRAAPDSSPTGNVPPGTYGPEFAKRVLPIMRDFFAGLDRAGVNPFSNAPTYHAIREIPGPKDQNRGTAYQFLMDDRWSALVLVAPQASGVMHFGQRGPDNPFRAISHANTNALQRLAANAIEMPEADARRILERVTDAFGFDRSRFEPPNIYPERMFDYDLGMYSMEYRKKGTDPVNQANYALSFSIKATSPTTAVLVAFDHDGRTGR